MGLQRGWGLGSVVREAAPTQPPPVGALPSASHEPERHWTARSAIKESWSWTGVRTSQNCPWTQGHETVVTLLPDRRQITLDPFREGASGKQIAA